MKCRAQVKLHSLWPCGALVLGHWPSLVRVMACRLFGAKPVLEPMMNSCQLKPWIETLEKTAEKYKKSFKICKCRHWRWSIILGKIEISWWRHQMETFSALLAICTGNSPVIGEFPTQRPVTRSFDVFVDLRLNERLSKQWWGWWFETPTRLLWRHRNVWVNALHGSLQYNWGGGYYGIFFLSAIF